MNKPERKDKESGVVEMVIIFLLIGSLGVGFKELIERFLFEGIIISVVSFVILGMFGGKSKWVRRIFTVLSLTIVFSCAMIFGSKIFY